MQYKKAAENYDTIKVDLNTLKGMFNYIYTLTKMTHYSKFTHQKEFA